MNVERPGLVGRVCCESSGIWNVKSAYVHNKDSTRSTRKVFFMISSKASVNEILRLPD
jgi:hypothetical protein